MEAQDVDQRLREIQREYVDFLDDEVSQTKHQLIKYLTFNFYRKNRENMRNS